MSDAVTGHAQLALIALTMDLQYYGFASTTAAKHCALAVQILRMRVQDLNELPGGSIIGAAALLTIIEVSIIEKTAYVRLPGTHRN